MDLFCNLVTVIKLEHLVSGFYTTVESNYVIAIAIATLSDGLKDSHQFFNQ